MAKVRLSIAEAEDGLLPNVCVCCGAEAAVIKRKKLAWHPPWVYILLLLGLLPFAIVALLMTKRATLNAPFCLVHKNHWLKRTLTLVFTFLALGLVGVLAIVAMSDNRRPNQDLGGFLCLGTLGLFVGWLILAIVLQSTAVRAVEITERDVLLTGVCEEFLDALEQADDDRYARRRAKRRLDRPLDEDEDEDEFDFQRELPPPDAPRDSYRERP